MKYTRLTLGIIGLGTIGTVCAEPDLSDSALELEPVTISSTRTSATLAEIPQAVQIIDQKTLTEQVAAGRTIADILGQLVPGLGPASGTTSNFGQTMRGRQIQVMVDGVPMTGSRDVARQFDSVAPELIERVEVISGATSLYGSGATGGIINLITKRNHGESLRWHSKGGLSTSNHSEKGTAYALNQSLSFSRGAFSGFFGADYNRRHADFDGRGQRIAPEPAQTGRQHTGTLDLLGEVGWQINKDQKLSLNTQYFNDHQHSHYGPDYGPGLAALLVSGYDPEVKAQHGLQLSEQPKTNRNLFKLHYNHQNFFGQNLITEAYSRREIARFFPFATAFPITGALPLISGLPVSTAVKRNYALQLQRNAFAVLQSQSHVRVEGFRGALQSHTTRWGWPMDFTYGLDYEREQDTQNAQSFDLRRFMQSNGLDYRASAQSYRYGPNVTIRKTGLFLQNTTELTPTFSLSWGVRHEHIRSRSDAFTPTAEALLQQLTSQYRLPYQAGRVNTGAMTHRTNLYNLGGVYTLPRDQQLFLNYSQGFSLPDLQRVLRDAPGNFQVNSENIQPIKVDSYETGWRLTRSGGPSATLIGFYNYSDKVVQLLRDYTVNVADTDERVYGLESTAELPLSSPWKIGGSIAWTRGQFKDAQGNWRELNAFRVAPLKTTAFIAWERAPYGIRLQAVGINGSDRAYDDAQHAAYDAAVRPTPAAKIKGYFVSDLLAHVKLGRGRLDMSIYNLFDTYYHTVYAQEASAVYGKLSKVPANGRTFAVNFNIDY